MIGVILQPSYLPWRGYFHLIQKADFFVFYDDVQFDKHGWRNRNRIKSPNGSHWITIPVLSKGNISANVSINQIKINDSVPWRRKHLSAIKQSYRKAPYFDFLYPQLESLLSQEMENLNDLDIKATLLLSDVLGITNTTFIRSSELSAKGTRTERLINILKELDCCHYISGPSAQAYIDSTQFQDAGIRLEYIEYGYPEYQQLYPPFEGQVSAIDLIFMHGPESRKFIWDVQEVHPSQEGKEK